MDDSQNKDKNKVKILKSKSKSKLRTEPTITHKNQVFMLESYLKKPGNDRRNQESKLSINKERSKVIASKDEKEIYKIEHLRIQKDLEDDIALQQNISQHIKDLDEHIIEGQKVKINPRLLQPVRQTAHLPPELHFKYSKHSNKVIDEKDCNKSLNRTTNQSMMSASQLHTSKSNQRNYSRNDNQPIKSLKRQITNSTTNTFEKVDLTEQQIAQNQHNISILSQNFGHQTVQHSHKQSSTFQNIQASNNYSEEHQNTRMHHLDNLNIENLSNIAKETKCTFERQNIEETEDLFYNRFRSDGKFGYQESPFSQKNNQASSSKLNDQRLLSAESKNLLQNSQRLQTFESENDNQFQEKQMPRYLIDLAQSNEKLNDDDYKNISFSNHQRPLSQFDCQNFIQSHQQIKNSINDHQVCGNNVQDFKFQSIDFRSHCIQKPSNAEGPFNGSQSRRTKRRELCLSQSSGYLLGLVTQLKTQISKSKSKIKIQNFDNKVSTLSQNKQTKHQYQDNKENDKTIQNQEIFETRMRSSRELLKVNSQYRLENIKQEMKRNLNEYQRSKERLNQQQKQITPIKDPKDIRKVSAFAQSVVSFSQRIDKLLSTQKSEKKLRNTQTHIDYKEYLSIDRKSIISSLNSHSNYNSYHHQNIAQNSQSKTKLEKENICEYQRSAQKQYQKLRERSNIKRDFNIGRKLLSSRELNFNVKQALPRYILKSQLDISSCESSQSRISQSPKQIEILRNKTIKISQ